MASSSYDRRNARARALGYSSYYDYRAHGNGRLPPSAPRLKGERLARARGHNSAADLRRSITPGTLVTATPDLASRRKDGTYGRFYITAIDADGDEREYLIRGAAITNVDHLISDLDKRGAIFSPSPSLDLRQIIEEPESVYAFVRRSRYLQRISRGGYLYITTVDIGKAILIDGLDAATDFYDDYLSHLRGARRFMIENVG